MSAIPGISAALEVWLYFCVLKHRFAIYQNPKVEMVDILNPFTGHYKKCY